MESNRRFRRPRIVVNAVRKLRARAASMNPARERTEPSGDHHPHLSLVPDAPDAITSNAGWDSVRHGDFLRPIIARFREAGIRTSIFVDPDPAQVRAAAATGTDRVELYTEAYASHYHTDRAAAVAPFVRAAQAAADAGLGLNAGHDLDLDNLAFFAASIPNLLEVSIGHALICDALYLGLENTIQLYQRALQRGL